MSIPAQTWAAAQGQLPWMHRGVLGVYAYHASMDTLQSWPSPARIAEELKCSKRTVQRIIRDLTRDGYLTLVHTARGKGDKQIYRVNVERGQQLTEDAPGLGGLIPAYHFSRYLLGAAVSPFRERRRQARKRTARQPGDQQERVIHSRGGKGDRVSGDDPGRVTSTTGKGDAGAPEQLSKNKYHPSRGRAGAHEAAPGRDGGQTVTGGGKDQSPQDSPRSAYGARGTTRDDTTPATVGGSGQQASQDDPGTPAADDAMYQRAMSVMRTFPITDAEKHQLAPGIIKALDAGWTGYGLYEQLNERWPSEVGSTFRLLRYRIQHLPAPDVTPAPPRYVPERRSEPARRPRPKRPSAEELKARTAYYQAVSRLKADMAADGDRRAELSAEVRARQAEWQAVVDAEMTEPEPRAGEAFPRTPERVIVGEPGWGRPEPDGPPMIREAMRYIAAAMGLSSQASPA